MYPSRPLHRTGYQDPSCGPRTVTVDPSGRLTMMPLAVVAPVRQRTLAPPVFTTVPVRPGLVGAVGLVVGVLVATGGAEMSCRYEPDAHPCWPAQVTGYQPAMDEPVTG